MDSQSLKVHEWLAVLVLITVIVALAAMTSFPKKPTSLSSFNCEVGGRCFEIVVSGSVKYPGIYHFSSPIVMRDLLEIAQTTPEADLRRYRMDLSITKGKNVDVPALMMMTVYVKGAVKNPGSIEIPSGSSVADLIPFLVFDEDANIKSLQKKRKLKEGEVIDVPRSKK